MFLRRRRTLAYAGVVQRIPGRVCASRSPVRRVAVGIAALGLGEFAVAALGDSLDAGHDLFLFQAATDLTICFAAAWLLQKGFPKTIRHTP